MRKLKDFPIREDRTALKIRIPTELKNTLDKAIKDIKRQHPETKINFNNAVIAAIKFWLSE